MSSANADRECRSRRRPAVVVPTSLRPPVRRATMTVRAVAFWAAVLLPFASLVVVFAGPVSRLDFLVLLGLLSANVVALYLGHGYPAERLAEGDGAAADGVVADGADAVSGRTGEGSD